MDLLNLEGLSPLEFLTRMFSTTVSKQSSSVHYYTVMKLHSECLRDVAPVCFCSNCECASTVKNKRFIQMYLIEPRFCLSVISQSHSFFIYISLKRSQLCRVHPSLFNTNVPLAHWGISCTPCSLMTSSDCVK